MIRSAAALTLVLLLAGAHWAFAACSDAPASAAETAEAALHAASEARFDEEYEALHATLVKQLTESANPRDWALAPDLESAERRERLLRAADAAPDDALVVWLAAQALFDAANTAPGVDPVSERIGERLQSVQVDNAAHLMPALARAVRQADSVAIDQMLAAMAAHSRFDTHFADSLHAWMALAERSDTAPTLRTIAELGARQNGERYDPEQSALVASMAFSSAAILPAYQNLFLACRPDADLAAQTRRANDCEKVGRLMTAQGQTIIDRFVGDALLRKIERRSDADRALRRRWEWLMAAYIEITPEAEQSASLVDAWRTHNDELAVMTQTVQAAGVSLDPPADWVSPSEAREQESAKQH